MNRLRVAGAGLAISFAAVLGACHGHPDATSPCNVTYNCAPGLTCTKTDPNDPFSCVPAGRGKASDPCYAMPGAPVTCGERMTCVATGNPQRGSCVAWCDDAHACTGGTSCTTVVTTMGDRVRVCAPCNVSYVCGDSETCATRDGNTFSCVPAGKSKAGSPCDASAGAPVSCAEELLCFSMGGSSAAQCTRWCDRTHPCLANKVCTSIKTTKGASLGVCL